jgi:hypothetical protein
MLFSDMRILEKDKKARESFQMKVIEKYWTGLNVIPDK